MIPGRHNPYLVQICMGLTWGGPHMYLMRLAEEARRRGYRSIIAASAGGELEKRAARSGLEVLSVSPNERGSFWSQLLGTTRVNQCQIVHLHSIRGLPRGFITLPGHIQMVLTEHSVRSREVLHPLSRMALSRVDSVLCISDALATANGRALGINPERVRVLHHGVDLNRFHPELREKARGPARERLRLDAADQVVLVPTLFRRDKNHSLVLEVVTRLKKSHRKLHVILTGNVNQDKEAALLRSELGASIRERGIEDRVHFTGYLERIEDAYAAADLVVVPTEFEGFGMPALEAMASGLPVIGSNRGAFPEIVVSGKTGYTLDVADADAWTRAVAELVDSPARAKEMGVAGRTLAEGRFALEDHWDKLFRIYVEGRPGRRRGVA